MGTPTTEDGIVAELVGARREGRSLTGFPGPVPADMAGAYRIQDRAMSMWPDSLVGWKIGYIAADRRRDGEPDRLVGPIWRRQCHRGDEGTGDVVASIFASGFAAVEAELVIRLGRDAGDRDDWTAAEAAALDQELLVAIEVASSPIPDINSLGPTVIAADFGNNNGLVLGPVLRDAPAALSAGVACYVDGRLIGEGSAQNLPGGIHSGFATALNVLSGRGLSARAGMVFATGAITGIHEIGPGQHCRVEIDGGPSVELHTIDGPGPARTA